MLLAGGGGLRLPSFSPSISSIVILCLRGLPALFLSFAGCGLLSTADEGVLSAAEEAGEVFELTPF
jgi:hypothetical protein